MSFFDYIFIVFLLFVVLPVATYMVVKYGMTAYYKTKKSNDKR